MIPGMWQGGWAFGPVLDRLAARPLPDGLAVSACDLPMAAGTGLLDHFETLLGDAAASHGEPLILVAHSYGGTPAIMLADAMPERVAGLLLVDAALPRDGFSVIDGYPAAHREQLKTRLCGSGRNAVLPPRRAVELGISDPRAAAEFDNLARPFPFLAMSEPVSLTGRWTRVTHRRAILAALGPRGGAEACAAYRAACLEAGIGVEVWDCGHQVMNERPDLLAEAICSLVADCLADCLNERPRPVD
nr:alpha/beta hydrolase [Martelella sp. HB161492]